MNNAMATSPRRKQARKRSEPQVRAAGGLLWRSADVPDGNGGMRPGIEVALIHRPRYDDWSFPKGKLERGESWEGAALREVAEEAGIEAELGDELPSTRYIDGKGRQKLVRYWLMSPVRLQPWEPNDEIDGRRWVPLADAASLLTYAHDRELLAHLQREHE
jgi:8-oxo-dGTP pyrophosphatase MutT (NUDIX family)